MKLTVRVGDVMEKNVRKVETDDTIEKAAQIMRNENVGSVIVMGEKQVKGIVTASDIVFKHVASKKGSFVKEIMTENPVRIEPSKTIEEAARLMVKNGIEKLLVFDGPSFVGIITSNDILRVEPAIVEILLERTKAGAEQQTEAQITECESCGNYSDSIEEVNGAYLCQECRME